VRVLVVGAGAVGSLFAARFARSGHAVTVVARPEHVTAIRAKGLRVEGTDSMTVRLEAATAIPEGISTDLAFLTTKAFDLAGAARACGGAMAAPVPTVLPQNGLGVESTVVSALRAAGWAEPERWVVRAVNSVPATLVAPGVVRQAGTGEVVLQDPAAVAPAAGATAMTLDLLTGSGFSVRLVPDLARELWRKALINAAINPVSALHRVPNGRLADPPLHAEALTLLREAQQAARAAGFEFTNAEAEADLDRVVRATAENRSSMLQDMDRGRPTEVDAISGEILRTAERLGIDLPATRSVVEQLGSPRRPSSAQSSY
jgi:2-dehydropantoate 2-reductase